MLKFYEKELLNNSVGMMTRYWRKIMAQNIEIGFAKHGKIWHFCHELANTELRCQLGIKCFGIKFRGKKISFFFKF